MLTQALPLGAASSTGNITAVETHRSITSVEWQRERTARTLVELALQVDLPGVEGILCADVKHALDGVLALTPRNDCPSGQGCASDEQCESVVYVEHHFRGARPVPVSRCYGC